MQYPELYPDAPYLKDRWEDEVNIEMEMLERGREIMQGRIEKARKKRDMTRLRPYRSLIREFVEPVAHNIAQWVEQTATKRGPKPIALKYLKMIEPDVAAVVALKTVFRMVGMEKSLLLGLAVEIGTWVEHEARAASWAAADPQSWEGLRRHYVNRGSNSAHIRRGTISVFNRHIKDKIGWEDWGEEVRRRVGLQLIDNVVQGTRRFKVVADKSAAKVRTKKGVKMRWPLVLAADDGMLSWLAGAMDDEMVYWPVFMPTLIEPKPWDGPKDGGYWTPFVKTPFLIRFKASHEDQRQRAIDEYMALDMPRVYEAVNFIQDTPWRINQSVLAVAQEAWDKDLALGGMPSQTEEHVPSRPFDWETNPAAFEEWRRLASAARTRNAKSLSQFKATRRTLDMSNRLEEEPRFFYPHMLDFRSRMYPIPSGPSPQGDDLDRGLLEFADGKPVGEDGGHWLGIQLANTFGVDKVSLQERVDWTFARKDLWLAVDQDPLGQRNWLEADSPWQALAAIRDFAGFLRQGNGWVSHAPIRVDGTCNGIQHLSALIRDEEGGASVNLIEGDSPRDIYGEVAETLTKELLADRGNAYARMWLDVFDGAAPRSVTKRPVMILPYGGSRMAYMEYTREWLIEHDPSATTIPEEHINRAIGYLVSKMWAAIGARLKKAQEVMVWLQDCSKIASQTGLPLYWKTPLGFVVRHFYGKTTERDIETNIDGQRVRLKQHDIGKDLDPRAQAKGIAPNFVHSLDASAMGSCALLCKDNGITHLTTIHDSYGTHAADMWKLYSCIREGFIETYRGDPLGDFQASCMELCPQVPTWPIRPKEGKLDIEAVRYSDYFFA